MKTEIYTLPAYWACYLIDGDDSGLEPGEKEQIDSFCEKNNLGAAIDCSEEQGFSWSNDASTLGGDVLEFTFLVGESA